MTTPNRVTPSIENVELRSHEIDTVASLIGALALLQDIQLIKASGIRFGSLNVIEAGYENHHN